jgi:phage baseplate assembly protein W
LLTQEITDQIEQRLGIRPGERMNRPDFGGGVDQFPYARLKW